MKKKIFASSAALTAAVVLIAAGLYLRHANIPVLQPHGMIGQKERRLIIVACLLSLIVVLPLFVMLGLFAWRYREQNTKAVYSPHLDNSRLAETIWWLVPSLIILVLSVITWNSSHELDPYRTIASKTAPLTIQVVALDWKWLFIYPQQNVASVNFVQLPVGTPVNFEITSDAPMNSFWIPQLGGQIYAMPGMSTQLHLIAGKAGDYNGSSANISGSGFAHMTFTARAGSMQDFNNWIVQAKQSAKQLDATGYTQLAMPGTVKAATYSSAQPNLYDTIVMKYMMPMGGDSMMDMPMDTPQPVPTKLQHSPMMPAAPAMPMQSTPDMPMMQNMPGMSAQ